MSTIRVTALGIMLLMMVPLAGCSVGMALSGEEDPDLSVVRVGAPRADVEFQLGSPIKTKSLDNNARVDTYEYEVGDEPSTGRAVFHGAMDILTLGIWEIVGTPVEAVQGNTYRALITYDEDDNVTDIKTRKAKSDASATTKDLD